MEDGAEALAKSAEEGNSLLFFPDCSRLDDVRIEYQSNKLYLSITVIDPKMQQSELSCEYNNSTKFVEAVGTGRSFKKLFKVIERGTTLSKKEVSTLLREETTCEIKYGDSSSEFSVSLLKEDVKSSSKVPRRL